MDTIEMQEFFATRWKMQGSLANGDELSTVELPYKPNGATVYESCWFYARGGSEVVAHYFSKADAVEGHCELLGAAARG